MNLLDPAQLPAGASDGPETWGEAFGRLATASDETQRVVENVVADDAARHDAYAGYIKEVQDATGVQIANPLDVDLRQGAFEAKPNPNISGGTGLEWREQKLQASLDQFEAARQKVAAQYPAQFNLIPLDIDGRMRRKMKAAEVEQGRAAQSPELGAVGRFSAQLLGGLKGSARDPYQWAMAVTGGGGSATGSVAARIGKTMLTEALVNGGQELVLQGASQERKKAAGLEHGLNDMLKNAGIAATFGALFGGTIEGGSAIARAYGLGEESAARASRILDGNPQRGDVEAMAADLGITLTEEQKSQVARSFEERVMDEHMLPADATPEQVRVFEAAKNYAEDPDNFPEPELVERAIADEQSGTRSLTADEYERLYSGGDPDAIDNIRDTFFARDADEAGRLLDERAGGEFPGDAAPAARAEQVPIDELDGQRIRPDRSFEPGEADAIVHAEELAGDLTSPRRQGQFGPIYDPAEFDGNWREAVNTLQAQESGEIPGMLSHPEIGPIDVVWGNWRPERPNKGGGLSKIAGKHPEVLDRLPEILPGMRIYERTANRIRLRDDANRAVVRLDYDGQSKTWLMTAFEEDGRRAGKTTDRSGSFQEDGHSSSSSSASEEIAQLGPNDNVSDLVSDPARSRQGETDSLLELVPIMDSDGNVSLVTIGGALRAADEENFFADVLEACKV